MDWLSVIVGFVSGLIGQVPAWFMIAQQRRKLSAEAGKTTAETANVWSELYDDLIKSLRGEIQRVTEERDLERERVRNLREENQVLYEQKLAAIGAVQQLTARLGREGAGEDFDDDG